MQAPSNLEEENVASIEVKYSSYIHVHDSLEWKPIIGNYVIYVSLKPFKTQPSIPPLHLGVCCKDDFIIDKVIGTGSFGRVFIARHKDTEAVCAVKSLSKAQIIKNGQVSHVHSERDVLSKIDHPFVVRMLSHFHDTHAVHFVMEYVAGGEFFTHLRSRGQLTEDVARFYAAEVLIVFEYLHSKDIAYRDLKVAELLVFPDSNKIAV